MFRKEIVRGCVSIVAGLVIWEILTRLLLENELLVPPPSSVLVSFWQLLISGKLNKHFVATLTEFFYGFTTACIVGIAIGYFMGMHRWFDEVMDPWIATLYSIPIITVVPLIIIWFGIGMISKVIVVFVRERRRGLGDRAAGPPTAQRTRNTADQRADWARR